MRVNKDGWCVYSHSYEGKIFYIGKGRPQRPFELHGRNDIWIEFMKNKDYFDVSIVEWFLDERDAYTFERDIVDTLRPECNMQCSGYKLSEEHKKAISDALTGITRSPETRKKMSDYKKSMNIRPPLGSNKGCEMIRTVVKCLENNVIYRSIQEAARQTNVSDNAISKQIRGKTKKTRGLRFVMSSKEEYIKYMKNMEIK